jgi:hypothetical protein
VKSDAHRTEARAFSKDLCGAIAHRRPRARRARADRPLPALRHRTSGCRRRSLAGRMQAVAQPWLVTACRAELALARSRSSAACRSSAPSPFAGVVVIG